MNTAIAPRIVDLATAWQERFGTPLPFSLGQPLEKLLGIKRLNTRYASTQKVLPASSSTQSYWSAFLAAWDIDYSVAEEELARIPTEGPVLLVANHPFGFVDGLV